MGACRSRDNRLGLTEDERRIVRVRFLEPLDDTLRTELTQLVRRRGSAAHRAAERIDPIELVIDDPHGEPQRISGRLQPPQVRHGQLRDIEFGLGEMKPVAMSFEPTSRLSGDQVVALKFAAHRQLARWANKPKLSPHQHAQRTALTANPRRPHPPDPAFANGCELRRSCCSRGSVNAHDAAQVARSCWHFAITTLVAGGCSNGTS